MAVEKLKVLVYEVDGVELDMQEERALSAANSEFDNTSNGFAADNVQEAIEEIGAGASPGFSFSKPSSLFSSTWLNKAGGVASNRAGVSVFINNPIITTISCTSENLNTYEITVYEHEGDEVNLNALGTVSVVNERSHIFTVSFPTSKGKQLAVRLTDGGAKNVGVDMQLKGSS